jgi:hypothetical protein
MKLRRLQNKVLRTIGKFPRDTPIRDMHISFQIPYVYHYITKLCRQQAQVIQHHENTHVHNIGQGDTENIKYLNLVVARHVTVQAIKLALQPELPLIGHNLLYEPGLKRDLICLLYIYEL